MKSLETIRVGVRLQFRYGELIIFQKYGFACHCGCIDVVLCVNFMGVAANSVVSVSVKSVVK